VVAVISNCGDASGRRDYVNALMKLGIKVSGAASRYDRRNCYLT
jgi:hypothetical protein